MQKSRLFCSPLTQSDGWTSSYLCINIIKSMLFDSDDTLVHAKESFHCMIVNPISWFPIWINATGMSNAAIAIESFCVMRWHTTAGHVRAGVTLIVNGNCFESHARLMQWRTSCCKTTEQVNGILMSIEWKIEFKFIQIYLVRLAPIATMAAAAAVKFVDEVSVETHSCDVWFLHSIVNCCFACPASRVMKIGSISCCAQSA